MNANNRQHLYLLAFDHRGSFQKRLLGIPGEPTPDQVRRIEEAKRIIFTGFRKARQRPARRRRHPGRRGVRSRCRSRGARARRAARHAGREERAGGLRLRVRRAVRRPHRVLPADLRQGLSEVQRRRRRGAEPAAGRPARSAQRLAPRERPQVPVRTARSARTAPTRGGRPRTRALRPRVAAHPDGRSEQELQAAGVEPDIWKIESLDARDDCVRLAEVARAGGRDHVDCVVLGRGGDESKVVHWLQAGAGVPGFVGFAVGRTIWWEPLVAWLDGATADATAATIAGNYRRLVDSYTAAEAAS